MGDEISALAARVHAGETRGIARACRLVDERHPAAIELLSALAARSTGAHVVGITGTPGAGKSTLVGELVRTLRAAGERVAVLAVDPTSPFSGGAILGDRIRMQDHFLDEGVFIRSLATRGQLGGLSRSAADVVCIMDAAGFDWIVVETVGVGQDELEVARLADTTAVILAPGLGDDVQAIKAGILEIADVFVVNKSDRPGADATVQDLQQMIALEHMTGSTSRGHGGVHGEARASPPAESARAEEGARDPSAWRPPIIKTVAHQAGGIDLLLQSLRDHKARLQSTGAAETARNSRRLATFEGALREALVERFEEAHAAQIATAAARISAGELEPYAAVRELLEH